MRCVLFERAGHHFLQILRGIPPERRPRVYELGVLLKPVEQVRHTDKSFFNQLFHSSESGAVPECETHLRFYFLFVRLVPQGSSLSQAHRERLLTKQWFT